MVSFLKSDPPKKVRTRDVRSAMENLMDSMKKIQDAAGKTVHHLQVNGKAIDELKDMVKH